MKNDNDFVSKYWICSSCAKEQGGVFPEGHVCTGRGGVCGHCEGKNQDILNHEGLIPQVDYDWPKDIKKDRICKVSRD